MRLIDPNERNLMTKLANGYFSLWFRAAFSGGYATYGRYDVITPQKTSLAAPPKERT